MAKPGDRSQQKLVKVYTCQNEMEARMVQELLRHAGIESAVNSEMAPGIYPGTWGGWGGQDILVIESEAEEARRIISEQHEAGGEPEDTGAADGQ